MSDYQTRFSGIGRLYGLPAQQRLQRAHVAIIGTGGVGSWAVEALARTGIGQLTLIDLDDVCVSNVNRQLPAMDGNIGKLKIEVLAERIQRINPECKVNAVADFFTASTADALLDAPYDCILDAIDDLNNKALLIARCYHQQRALVTMGGAGGRRDPLQITAADLSLSGQDGLLRRLRRALRHEHGLPERGPWNIPCVFSREQAVYPSADGGVCTTPDKSAPLKLDCSSGFGTATFVTGAFGFIASSLVVDALLTER